MATRLKAVRKSARTARASKIAPTENGWRASTISEFEENEKGFWRAQKLLSPDGDKLLGLTRFAVKQNGEAVVTRNRITLKVNDDTGEILDGIIELLQELRSKVG